MRILKRIGNVVEGLVFMVVSLCVQAIFVILVTMTVFVGLSAVGLKLESDVWQWLIFALLIIGINALACWEYFCKRRAEFQVGKTSSVIFMFPRAVDLIWNGSERSSR
jgi:FtsH-binding integral membrane protein